MKAVDQFSADHAPGNLVLTASRWPCLVLQPDLRPKWLCSPYSLALHMLGREPMPNGDAKTLRRGKLMESVGKVLLDEDHGTLLSAEQVRCERAEIPAVCYLDGLSGAWGVEFKSMPERIYRSDWHSGPPWYPRIQAQAQMAINQELVGVLIAPIVMDYAGNPEIPQVYEEPRDPFIGSMLVDTGRDFLAMLRRGELPPPDETVASYEAIKRTLKLEPDSVVTLDDEESAMKFTAWQMYKHEEKAGRAGDEACKRFFAAKTSNASVIELPGVGTITRKRVEIKAEKEPRPARTDLRWILRELSE